jgi:iron-sulfur cluster assembly protein
MINISDSAKKRLLYLLDKDTENKQFVRVGVETGGCSGLSYKLDFDDAKNEDDELIEDNGIKLLVSKKSFLYLVGTTLEFSDGLNGKGFVFNNPNANRTCGCGESFSL